jgi:DNA-directed RNA polymerase specialized sigma24 family protein
MADSAAGDAFICESMSPEEASRHLHTFAATRCERAFRKLTEGHAGLVYSTALRVVQGDAALAEDIVQIVFSALAAKPHSVRDGKALAAWLHRAAVRRAIDAMRVDSRRRKREQLSMHMTPPTPQLLSPASAPLRWLWQIPAPPLHFLLKPW